MAKTPKAVALGSALRQARVDKGHKLREFAAMINRDPAMLSRWETGDRIPKPEHVAQILTVLGVNGDQYDDIMTLVYGTGEPQWVATTLPEQRQQLAAYLEYEQQAATIIEVSPLMIPGLLQTADHIRAIMSGGGVPAGDIPTRIAVRLGRKEIITGGSPARLVALVGQAALYQGIGGRDASIAQLRYLLEMMQRPNVELRIIPFGMEWHPGLEGAFVLIESNGPASVVFLETRRSTLWLHKEDDVNAYKHAVDMILRVTLSPQDSARLISELVHRMENRGDEPDHLAKVEP
ncbi:helix-turn-helix domain-containing protein [Actinokineospora sp. HUAS TT18]|uniref:helix-turn-helix domain-containing protein n=1 Tax=Actinokineospora sp. HUAS TT18 TaxID=3447451 RepID=UPI003F527A79